MSIDQNALYKIGYGLYVVTSSDGKKDNGLILNTVMQVSNDHIAVGINKRNYSHDVIKESGVMNVCCLTEEAPFKVFESFGFRSGREVDKFEGCSPERSENGLAVLPKFINAYLSLKVESYVDLDSHGLFVCSVTEGKVISDTESMTYSYYHKNVKPKPEAKNKAKGYLCKICGYIHDEEELPDDFVCPLCGHPASDFEPLT